MKVFKLEVRKIPVETDVNSFIPEWFQLEFGEFLNKIIETYLLKINQENKNTKENFLEELYDKKENSTEYVNWEKTARKNHFTVSGFIKYQTKLKVILQIYISKGDAIKFSRNYSYEIDNVIDSLLEILNQMKDFILSSLGKENTIDYSIDVEKHYLEIAEVLESKEEDRSPEKYFISGLFWAKAGDEEKALKNLNYVISSSINPEILQECYKTILTVKTKKNMKDLENAQNEIYKGDPNKAIPLLEDLLQITPQYTHLHFLLGMAYKRSGQHKKAIEAFEKALEIDPNNVSSLRELAEEWVVTDNPAKAEEVYRRIINLNQANATDYYNLGMCLKRMKKIDELNTIVDKVKELDTEGKLESYLFNLIEIKSESSKDEASRKKNSLWRKLFKKIGGIKND